MKVEKYRDLTLMHVSAETLLVIACDSCGGIGLKEKDVVKTGNEVVGYYTASVILCELLSFGATPQMIVNNFCVEMNPSGEQILCGIKTAIEDAGLDPNILLTGSTEENIPVVQTAIGLTCIGVVDLKSWTKPQTKPKDSLFAIGTPKVGTEVSKSNDVKNLKILSQIKNKAGVHEILPVGSKGIAYEVNELCRCNELSFDYLSNMSVDIHKSAGPVTCLLVTGDKDSIEDLLQWAGANYYYLGKFR